MAGFLRRPNVCSKAPLHTWSFGDQSMRYLVSWTLLTAGIICLGLFLLPGHGEIGPSHGRTGMVSTLGATWTDLEDCWYRRTLVLKDGVLEARTEIVLASWAWLLLGGGLVLLLVRTFTVRQGNVERLVSSLIVIGAGAGMCWMTALGGRVVLRNGVLRLADTPDGQNRLPFLYCYDEAAIVVVFLIALATYLLAIWQPRAKPKTA